jgi:hypothetical protein
MSQSNPDSSLGQWAEVVGSGYIMGVRLLCLLVCLLPAGEGLAQSDPGARVVENIVPWLA